MDAIHRINKMKRGHCFGLKSVKAAMNFTSPQAVVFTEAVLLSNMGMCVKIVSIHMMSNPNDLGFDV